MGTDEFVKFCKKQVREYVLSHLDKSDSIPEFDVYVVWNCKTLQNNKALLSTTLLDGMYYEITYNGDKKEAYFDAYKKFENKCIKLDENEVELNNIKNIIKNCLKNKIDDYTINIEYDNRLSTFILTLYSYKTNSKVKDILIPAQIFNEKTIKSACENLIREI